MKRMKFKPEVFVHFVGIIMPLAMFHLAYRSSVDEFVHGGQALRIALVGVCLMMGAGVLWLYFISGLIVYAITDEGLVVSRLKWSSITPWQEITEIRWNPVLHYFSMYAGKEMVSFSSTDFFPEVGELICQIYERSGCEIPSHLSMELFGEVMRDEGERDESNYD